MAGPLIIRIVGDETSYLRAAENTVAANTKLDASFDKVGANAKRSADIQIAAAVKAHEALRANITALRTAAASAPTGSREQIAATNLANAAQLRLARSTAVTSSESEKLSAGAKNAERDVGKLTRGLLAGSGAASAMGRSLAFASGSFIGIAAVSSAIRSAVAGADELDKANRSLGVVLARNRQEAGLTVTQLDKWAKAQQNLGVSQTEALSGLRETVVLTGSASKGMLAYRMGLELSSAENIDLDSALRIAAKAIQGQTTSLTRYGIILPKTTNAQKIFNAFQARFAKQAETNTSAFDRLRASYSNVATDVGVALLPVFEKYAASLSDWLQKTQNQKKLTDEVVKGFHAVVEVFTAGVSIVKKLDIVTGGFANTLKILAAFKLASLVNSWIGSLSALIGKWTAVKAAATEAQVAETAALGTGGAAGAAGGARSPIILPPGVKAPAAAEGASTLGTIGRFGALAAPLFAFGDIGETGPKATSKVVDGWQFFSIDGGKNWIRGPFVGFPSTITPEARSFPRTGNIVPPAFTPRGFGADVINARPATQPGPLFGGAKPVPQITTFALTGAEQLQQAQAQLTRSQQDDVTAARQVVARIKRLIDEGRLTGAALLQALQAEGSALSTIWSAEDAAAQQRAQAAAAAKAKLQAQLAASIDPLKDEIALSRAQAFGGDITAALKKLLRDALDALHKGLPPVLEKQALDQVTSLKQQIQQAQSGQAQTFQVPPELQLALAKDAALGRDTTNDLLKLRKAILKFIATHRHNIAALTDAYNQLAGVNQQLGATAQSALGAFKELNLSKLTAGLGLTKDEMKKLKARLSQVGPNNTVPGSGTGAFGFVIGDNGRPQTINLNVDGKRMASVTTKHQQKQRRRNSTQRRGPNAGVPVTG